MSKDLVISVAEKAAKTAVSHTFKDSTLPPGDDHDHLIDGGVSFVGGLVGDTLLDRKKRNRAANIAGSTLETAAGSAGSIVVGVFGTYISAMATPIALITGNAEGAKTCAKATVRCAGGTITSALRGTLSLFCGSIDLVANSLGVEGSSMKNMNKDFDRLEKSLGIRED